MDAITLTVLFKGTGMVLAIAGGVLVARYGFHLYRSGTGSHQDKAVFEVGPLKLKANSVGSVVMATAFLWAWAGVTISPNLDKRGDEIRIYSFNTPEGELKAQAIPAKVASGALLSAENPDQLKDLFLGAVSSEKDATTSAPIVELNGNPAAVDQSSVAVSRSQDGDYKLTTTVKSMDKTAVLVFEPKVESGKIVFTPSATKNLNRP